MQALADFRARIAKYEEVYQTLTDRNMHYIKLIDMWVQLRSQMLAMRTQGTWRTIVGVHMHNSSMHVM